MKNIFAILLCIMIMLSLAAPIYAHEGHDHGVTTLNTPSVDALDQDGDGIPDYMDNLVDLDGDGVHDIEPTYQEPAQKGPNQTFVDTPWFVVLIIFVFIGMVAATVYLKAKTKSDSAEQGD